MMHSTALAATGLLCALVLGASASAQAQAQAQAAGTVDACVDQHVEAQRARQRGELLHARTQLLLCAQKVCPALVSNDCTTWLAEVEASLPTIVLAVQAADGSDLSAVKVTANAQPLAERVDGKPIELDPGSYELSFEAEGHAPLRTHVTVHQGEKDRIVRVQLARAVTPGHDEAAIPVLSYVLGGVAVAGLGAFGYFGLKGASDERDAERSCAPDCRLSTVDDIERSYLIADVGLGVGLASAVAALIVYLVSQPPERAETAAFELSPARDGAAMRMSARF